MTLFRWFPAALLIAGVLPCGAQSLPSQPSSNSVPLAVGVAGMEGSPCVMVGGPKSPHEAAILKKKLCADTQKKLSSALANYLAEKPSTCYAIRDYRFAVPKDSGVPKLKSYSTCSSAARFEARNVVKPSR